MAGAVVAVGRCGSVDGTAVVGVVVDAVGSAVLDGTGRSGDPGTEVPRVPVVHDSVVTTATPLATASLRAVRLVLPPLGTRRAFRAPPPGLW